MYKNILHSVGLLRKKVNRKMYYMLYEHIRKSTFEFNCDNIVDNVFDYNFVIHNRKPKEREVYEGNMMYGMGDVLRRYTGYSDKIYCATEHGVPTEREDNTMEYRDNDMPTLLVHSEQRRDFLKEKTDKLMFTIGPSFMPYTEGVYTDFSIKNIRKNLGKTLLVYPQHNNDTSEFIEFTRNRDKLIEYVKHIKEVGHFNTVIICLFYIDIERNLQYFYEKEGWIVVSAGKNTNYDFPACFKSILKISDYVIAQSISGIAFAMYENIPCTYYSGERKIVSEGGTIFDDAWTINGKSWLEKTEQVLYELFGEYSPEITPEQKAWCKYTWGYDCVKSAHELNLILQFSKKIRKKYKNLSYVKKIAEQEKYSDIREYIDEALGIMEQKRKAIVKEKEIKL